MSHIIANFADMNQDKQDYNSYDSDPARGYRNGGGADSYNYRPDNRRPRHGQGPRGNTGGTGLRNFYRRYPIWSTLILIALASVVLVWLLLLFTDVWTHHGAKTTVPSIKGMQYDQAVNVLEGADLTAVIADSIYDGKQPGGTVVEVWPKAGATVKSGREVYLTIVAYSPRMVVIDMPLTDISQKQAENYLASHGITAIDIRYVPAEYDNSVVAAKYDGRLITMGSRIPANATIVLEVGQAIDSLSYAIDVQADSIFNSEPVVEEPAATDEPSAYYE